MRKTNKKITQGGEGGTGVGAYIVDGISYTPTEYSLLQKIEALERKLSTKSKLTL